MPILRMQKPSVRSLALLTVALMGVLGTEVLNGRVTDASTVSSLSIEQDLAHGSKPNRPGKHPESDTTRPDLIPVKPCSVHATYRNREKAFLPYEPVRDDVVPSVHEFTCRWAVGNDLSIDSTRLPTYVRPTGDSLRVADDVLAYNVIMTDSAQPGSYNVLYFVAEVEDSLFYHQVDEHYHNPNAEQSWQIRALRPLGVSGASAQYVWLEYNSIAVNREDGNRHVSENWTGHIYTYDDRRGFRFLQWAPIRSEIRKNGKLIGAKQWDASVPEAGFMRVERRLQKGKDLTLEPPEHWLGLHVIDSSAAGTESVRPSRD